MFKSFTIAAALVAVASPAFAQYHHTPAPAPVPVIKNYDQRTYDQRTYGGKGGDAKAAAAAAATSRIGDVGGGAGGGGGQGGGGGAGGGGGQGGGGGTGTGGNSAGQSVNNVGNNYYTPSAASAYSQAYGQFCIGAVGVGVQPPMMIPGVSFSITWMRDLCRWGHIAELMKSKGDTVGELWAYCQISEFADADRNGLQQCPQNRAKQAPASAAPTPVASVVRTTRAQCISAANVHVDQNAYKAAVAACPTS